LFSRLVIVIIRIEVVGGVDVGVGVIVVVDDDAVVSYFSCFVGVL
jgi:hypothetical protein